MIRRIFFCIEGRYPAPLIPLPTNDEASEKLRATEDLFQWLKSQL